MKPLKLIVLAIVLLCVFLTPKNIFAQKNEKMFYATIQTRDAQGLKINHPEDIKIIESLNGFSAVMLTSHAAEELHHKVLVHGPGFIYQPNIESALKTIKNNNKIASRSQSLNSLTTFSITQETLVRQSLDLVNNLNIAAQIQELEAYGSRYHTTATATQSVLDLRDKWVNMASGRSDVSVRIVNHTSTNMPSVVMTITGTEKPEEFVIIGGHIDSTASGGNANNAPGADDNASGIATFTEAARVLFEMNFKPKRTIEFMAFAAEEVGLRGSNEIAVDYKNRNVNVVSYMQLDMTNYKGSTNDIYISTDSYNDDNLNNFLIELMNFYNASGTHQLTYGTSQCNYGCSDHYSWAQQGYDVAFPFEASFNQSNPNIHTTRDTFDRSPTPNATHAAKFAKLALEYLIEISNGVGTNNPPGNTCSQTISTFPFNESFESSFGDFSQDINDDIDYTRNSGTTPSNNTGPSSASDGSFYAYVEASVEGTGYPNKTAILNAPCFDFSSLNSPNLTFDYHMLGSSIGSLTVEARIDDTGSWSSIFSKSGAEGNNWNTASVDLSSYANESNVQIRFIIVTGTGNEGWQSDIAIDSISVDNGTTTPPPPTCEAINFNDFSISAFSNQDSNGAFNITNSGNSLELTNNTWKYININYNVTSNTIIEFEFSSSSQGEIHGIGFEDDNNLTSSRYFKIHGTQNYGVTNYDNYSSGTTTYAIPVGSFYTGNMDRLVFINDNDAGSGNTSTFSNVKIYESSCSNSNVAQKNIISNITPSLGKEGEGILENIKINYSLTENNFQVNINNEDINKVKITLYNINGKKFLSRKLDTQNNLISAKKLHLTPGVYLVKLETEGEDSITKKIIVK
ncbi:M20/M25/M40 family metallo-hydrolase [Tenacibaculum sp. M341]|uniref:M20/M25/M40 family metallo-hydrolase n=1 Tax=Tenacibaculum sp. M341 TaxID=2530339 RepID=UPI00104C6C7D|nr:M20/M25/M40 family metallo-hydrolase [Tenacibaculum sp. M341]TCI91769.1 M20/M25/M40 family metallo-hydrolase [Tenacibaculum sp. M341]